MPSSLADDHDRLVILDRLAVLHQYGLHHPCNLALDLIEDLHCLDDADDVADFDRLTHVDEGLRVGRWRTTSWTAS